MRHELAAAPAAATRDGSAHHTLLALGRLLAGAGYRHTAISAASHQHVVRRQGAAEQPPLKGGAAALKHVFGLSGRFSADDLDPAVWGAMNGAAIVRRDGSGWRSKLRVATLGSDDGLLFFHSAWPTVEDDAVFFDPDTYRFLRALRPALLQGPVRRAIDIGCGAGAGAVLIARHWPAAEVLAVDLNVKALTLTAVNADLAGAHRVRPVRSDILDRVEGDFDLIVAHPPYLLDPCGRPLRHGGGVHGEQRSFDIVSAAIGRLAPGGRLLLYTGVAMVDGVDPLLSRLPALLGSSGSALQWRYEEIDPDIHGDELLEAGYEQTERIAAVWLEVQRPA